MAAVLKQIPAVSRLLESEPGRALRGRCGDRLATDLLRQAVDALRTAARAEGWTAADAR